MSFRSFFAHPKDEFKAILHLPLVERLLHVMARRTLMAVSLGVILMAVGSTIAASAKDVEHYFGLNHIIVDVVGYFLHGAGALPAFRFIEPLWTLILGASEAAAEKAAEVATEAAVEAVSKGI